MKERFYTTFQGLSFFFSPCLENNEVDALYQSRSGVIFLKHTAPKADFSTMSAILSADDLNDFISPGVACIKPVETLPQKTPQISEVC